MKRALTPVTMFLRSSTTPYYIPCHSFSSSSLIPHKNNEEDAFGRNVRVSVWWDFENCPVPNGVSALNVATNVTRALRANGIKGPVTITAFGDFIQLTRSAQEFLSSTGISLKHVPSGGKNTADRALLADLVFWVSQNPPPAHLFLISGDTDFASILHRLRMNNYNILLASRYPAPGVLCSAASIMWRWYELIKGENFGGKHFNTPPDGPWESWYGQKRGPLEDPFQDMGQLTAAQAENSPHAVTGSKHRAIPKIVVNGIRQVVNSYPKGIDITVLHNELGKSNVPLDEDYFGYRKFSLLLKSLPKILKLQIEGNGQMLVHGIQSKEVEPVTPSNLVNPAAQPKIVELPDRPEIVELANQPKIDKPVAQPNIAAPVDQPRTAESVDQLKVAEPVDQPIIGEAVDSKLAILKANNGDRSGTVNAKSSARINCLATAVTDISSVPAYSPPKPDPPPVGPYENDERLTEGHLSCMEDTDPISDVGVFRRAWRKVFGHNSDASDNRTNNSPELCPSFDGFEKKEPDENFVARSVSSSNSSGRVLEEKNAANLEEKDRTLPTVGMFSRMRRWFRPLETSTNPDYSHAWEEVSKSNSQIKEVNKSSTQINNTEFFLKVAFWDDMLSFLQSPAGSTLISQSKTREQLAQQLKIEGPSPLDTLPRSDLIHLVDLLISEKNWVEESISRTYPFKLSGSAQTPSSSSVPPTSNELSSIFSGKSSKPNFSKQPFGRSKSEILTDLENLMAETLKKYPEGFDVRIFRKSFRDKYGYILDHQKLGYPKLAGLLEIVPGVVIDSNHVRPFKSQRNVIPYGVETVKARNLDSEDDSMWEEELGPISTKKGTRSDFGEKNDLSDEFSDLEGTDGKSVMRNIEGESSLLKILDSCYGKNDKGNEDEMVYKMTGIKGPRPKKGKAVKGNVDEQEKLVNGILGTLKK